MQTDTEQSQWDLVVRKRLDSLAVQVRSAANAVRKLQNELEFLGLPQGAAVSEVASRRINDFATYLETTNLQTLVIDARTYAREHPMVVVAGAFGAGLATARMIKSGSGA